VCLFVVCLWSVCLLSVCLSVYLQKRTKCLSLCMSLFFLFCFFLSVVCLSERKKESVFFLVFDFILQTCFSTTIKLQLSFSLCFNLNISCSHFSNHLFPSEIKTA
jgi:hypothetical protein